MKAVSKSFLIIGLLIFSLVAFAQKKQIKVQIMHEDKVVVDTTIYKSSKDAKFIIENLVQKFSTEPVTIDTKLTHGLYVFNITNDNWKEAGETISEPIEEDKIAVSTVEPEQEEWDTKSEDPDYNNDIDNIDIDSLFKEFSSELNNSWQEAQIDIFIDSVGSSFSEMWNEMKKIDLQNDPDIQNLKSDFNELFEKIKTTKFVIIQEGDTLDFD